MYNLNSFLDTKYPIILASASPRREALLNMIGLEFEIIPAIINENEDSYDNPVEMVEVLAFRKAKSVANSLEYPAYVIGADTTVFINSEILNKPQGKDDAFLMLKKLSNNTHQVFTGVCLYNSFTNQCLTFSVETKVTFRKLSNEEIMNYVEGGSPMDKAGSYGIQDDFGAVFVSRIEGCYYNIVGFPVSQFYSKFIEFLSE